MRNKSQLNCQTLTPKDLMLEQFTLERRALELQALTSLNQLEVTLKILTAQAHNHAKIKFLTSSRTSQQHQTEEKQSEASPKQPNKG